MKKRAFLFLVTVIVLFAVACNMTDCKRTASKTAYDDLFDKTILLYGYEPNYMYRWWNDDPEIYQPDKFAAIDWRNDKKNKLIQQLEAKYNTKVLNVLQQFFSPDRVRDLHIKIDMNLFNTTQEGRNLNIGRITVSVNIDGTWNWKYDKKGNPVVLPDGSIEREYTPVPEEDLRKTADLIRNAIGYNSSRGNYYVTVTNIPFDRSEQFKAEDAAYFKHKQMQMTVIIILSGLALLLISFVIFRGIARHAVVTET